jgi:hypothetical protein
MNPLRGSTPPTRHGAQVSAVLGGLAVGGGWPLSRPEGSLWVPRVILNARPRSHWSRPNLHDMRLVGTELGLPALSGLSFPRRSQHLDQVVGTRCCCRGLTAILAVTGIERRDRRFVGKLGSVTSADLEADLICGSACTHKTPAIRRWLLAHSVPAALHPPTSSSWLNQAGRWFALLTGKQLGHGVLKNVQVLERDSRS